MSFQYGTIETVIEENGVTYTEREVIAAGATTGRYKNYTESIRVKNDDQVLAVFLKLQDDKKQGRIRSYGLKTYEDKEGRTYRIEKYWSI